MNRFFTLLLAASCLAAVGQISYPYNPDEDGNGQIAVGDLQGILATYGNEFSPSEILVDGETLTVVLTQLQNSIDSLSSLTGGGGSVMDMPLGTVLPIASESVPEGWMLCDGREISIEEYQELYDLIGTTYGAGDSAFWAQVFYPATTFNIPDLRGRTIIGANNMGGEESDVIVEHLAQIGEKGGAEMHSLAEAELPEHTHEVQYFRRTYGSGAGHPWNGTAGDYSSAGDPQWVSNSVVRAAGGGGNQPHNNMQPYMALNYMMKVQVEEDIIAELESEIQTLTSTLDSIGALVSSVQQPIFSFDYPDGFEVFSAVNANLEVGPYVVPQGFNLYVSEFEARPDHTGGFNAQGILCDGWRFIIPGCGTVYDDGYLFGEGMELSFNTGVYYNCGSCTDCANSANDYCYMTGFLVPKSVNVLFQPNEFPIPEGFVFVHYDPSASLPTISNPGEIIVSPKGYLIPSD